MRLLMTGSSGFVGRHMLKYLRDNASRTEILTPALDITDRPATEAFIKTSRPDALLHLAAIAAPGQAAAAPARAQAVNVQGALNLAEAVLTHAPECRFLFISSAEIYGKAFLNPEPVTEDTPPEPATLYATTKAEAEEALAALPGLRLLRLRPANHTGPGQPPDFVIPAFARQIARIEVKQQEPVLETGNLDACRDFLDVRDVCAAYGKALALPGFAAEEALNIASGTPQRIGDLLEIMLDMARAEIRLETDPTRLRPAEIPVTRIDSARARARLGWAPERSLRETLAGTLAFWRTQVTGRRREHSGH